MTDRVITRDEDGHWYFIPAEYLARFNAYVSATGIIQGPFEDCNCLSHHQHSTRGAAECPVCNP